MITFTRSWRGYAAGTSVSTLADTIEAIAVAEGAATYGGVSYPPNSYLDADNRTQALVDGGGNFLPPTTPRLQNVTRQIALGKMPVDMVVFGDSTGDETTEWAYLMAQYAASGIAVNHGVAYRIWNDVAQRYSTGGVDYISNGPLGRRYISAGANSTSHYFSLTDSAALNTTPDAVFMVRINTNGVAALGTSFSMAAKFNSTGNQRSWRFDLNSDGKIVLGTSADGTTEILHTSTVSIFTLAEVIAGQDVYLWAFFDGDNGASGNTVTFYYSLTEPGAKTIIGTAVTVGGTSSLFDCTSPLAFPGRGAGGISSVGRDIKFYEFKAWADLAQTSLVAWIDCGSVPPRTSATSTPYVDDCGNAGTLVFQASTVGGSPRLCLFNASSGGQAIAYSYNATRFALQAAGRTDACFINYGHNEGFVTTYRTDYKALTDLIVAKNPSAAIVGVLQNQRIAPATVINEHEIRIGQVAQFMAEIGGDVLDFFGLVNSSEMKTDGVHPDPALGAGVKMGNAAYALLARNAGRWRAPT